MESIMILVKNVYLSYTKEYFTLNNINLEIAKGTKAVLFGEQDSGKSSLLRVIAGLEKPTKGNVYLNTIDIEKVNFKNDVNLGYIGSAGVYLNNKTVRKNLEYVLKIRKENKDVINSKVANALIKYNMEGIADKKVRELSYFDKLRLSIARLSLRKLDLVVIDDVFVELNTKEQSTAIEYIKELIEFDDVTSVIATSNKKLCEKLGDNIIKIKFGSIE